MKRPGVLATAVGGLACVLLGLSLDKHIIYCEIDAKIYLLKLGKQKILNVFCT